MDISMPPYIAIIPCEKEERLEEFIEFLPKRKYIQIFSIQMILEQLRASPMRNRRFGKNKIFEYFTIIRHS